MTSREVILREIGLTPIWVNRPSAVPAPAAHAPLQAVARPPFTESSSHSQAEREEIIAKLSWDELIASIAVCTACKLCETRSTTVPGAGDRSPSWMVVGAAPDEDEEKQGEPFVARAGLLFDAMLVAVGKKRGEGVFVANVIKCRPPGNREPEPSEIAACAPYLNRQISLAQPKLLLAMGTFAARTLLNCDDTVSAPRTRPTADSQKDGIPVVVTAHPSELLRHPLDKARAWEDLLKASALVR